MPITFRLEFDPTGRNPEYQLFLGKGVKAEVFQDGKSRILTGGVHRLKISETRKRLENGTRKGRSDN